MNLYITNDFIKKTIYTCVDTEEQNFTMELFLTCKRYGTTNLQGIHFVYSNMTSLICSVFNIKIFKSEPIFNSSILFKKNHK